MYKDKEKKTKNKNEELENDKYIILDLNKEENLDNIRIDKYLSNLNKLNISREKIKKGILSGSILLNLNKTKNSSLLKNSDYISFVAVRTGLNNFGKREINYSLEGAGIAIKLTIRAELTDMGSCGTAIHIYEVLLNDKKWKPTIGKNKALIYTLKSSMLTVK